MQKVLPAAALHSLSPWACSMCPTSDLRHRQSVLAFECGVLGKALDLERPSLTLLLLIPQLGS